MYKTADNNRIYASLADVRMMSYCNSFVFCSSWKFAISKWTNNQLFYSLFSRRSGELFV